MTDLNIGDNAPDFTSATDGNKEITLSSLKGQKVVLYFYPKDDTPGCTKESCGFNEALQAFNALNTQIIGVSNDTIAKHDKFKAKYNLNFPLISDENGEVCDAYGVWKEKSMYGRTFMGIERSTFLINEDGKIVKIWRKVKVKDHVDDVRATIIEATKAA